jgi:hypothetical protein
MTSVTSQVVEARRGKMVTAKKLAVLQSIKQEKGLLIRSFLDDLTQQNSEKWKEMTKFAESLGLAVAVLS